MDYKNSGEIRVECSRDVMVYQGFWPGMTHFPDFLNPEVRNWFGKQYRFYTGRGIEGFWNDMNESAIFYTELLNQTCALYDNAVVGFVYTDEVIGCCLGVCSYNLIMIQVFAFYNGITKIDQFIRLSE